MPESSHVRSPQTITEWDNYYRFRWEILRKPLGQELGTEKDEEEAAAIHAFILAEDGQVIAVGRLQKIQAGYGQIRYMAVHEKHRQQHLGTFILLYLEEQARQCMIHSLFLHARKKSFLFINEMGTKCWKNRTCYMVAYSILRWRKG
jgi:N-acetylglutamate synthase-like GNAT family acetyltransferase